jgi:outer membrane immunogenic protein
MTWFGTVTARVGVAVDHALVYVKAGGAWAHFDHTITSAAPAGFPLIPGPLATLGENRAGGTAGVGIEYKFWRHWSAKLEYDYMDFGTKNLQFVSAPALGTIFTNNINVTERISVVRAGLNYQFDWGSPVVASY